MTAKGKEAKDSRSECGQVFFTGRRGYGLMPDLRSICLGKEEDVTRFFDTGELNEGLSPLQRRLLGQIQEYRKGRALELEKQIWSEQALMELLGVTKKQLDNLRLEKGLPCVHINRRVRIYFADEVMEFLKTIRDRR